MPQQVLQPHRCRTYKYLYCMIEVELQYLPNNPGLKAST